MARPRTQGPQVRRPALAKPAVATTGPVEPNSDADEIEDDEIEETNEDGLDDNDEDDDDDDTEDGDVVETTTTTVETVRTADTPVPAQSPAVESVPLSRVSAGLTAAEQLEIAREEGRKRVQQPDGHIIKFGEKPTISGIEQAGGLVVTDKDIFREVFVRRSKTPTYVLVARKGTRVSRTSLRTVSSN